MCKHVSYQFTNIKLEWVHLNVIGWGQGMETPKLPIIMEYRVMLFLSIPV